jgi:hypothetical protein
VNRGHYFGTSSFQEEPGLSDDGKRALIEYLERLVHNAHRIECAANRCASNAREGRKRTPIGGGKAVESRSVV